MQLKGKNVDESIACSPCVRWVVIGRETFAILFGNWKAKYSSLLVGYSFEQTALWRQWCNSEVQWLTYPRLVIISLVLKPADG